MLKRIISLFVVGCAMMAPTFAAPNPDPAIEAFIQQMVKDYKFDEKTLEALFLKVHLQEPVINSVQSPKEALSWHDYSNLFITQQRIEDGVAFWKKYETALNAAAQEYGVPPEIIVGVLGVETKYGTKQGDNRVIDALATLAFKYPQRSDYFKRELAQFLLLSQENHFDPLSIRGSYAGAFGMPQFMPSSYRRYAIDVGKKGKSDLINNPFDAIASIANYLKGNGWQAQQSVAVLAAVTGEDYKPFVYPDTHHLTPKSGTNVQDLTKAGVVLQQQVQEDSRAMLLQLTIGPEEYQYWVGLNNLYVIMRYNPSVNYAMAVFTLGDLIKDQINAEKSKSSEIGKNPNSK